MKDSFTLTLDQRGNAEVKNIRKKRKPGGKVKTQTSVECSPHPEKNSDKKKKLRQEKGAS